MYGGYVDDGRPPTVETMATALGLGAGDVHESLAGLDEARHIVLNADGDIVMAHPFASVPLGFSEMGSDTLWWGGFAWDSFAIP